MSKKYTCITWTIAMFVLASRSCVIFFFCVLNLFLEQECLICKGYGMHRAFFFPTWNSRKKASMKLHSFIFSAISGVLNFMVPIYVGEVLEWFNWKTSDDRLCVAFRYC